MKKYTVEVLTKIKQDHEKSGDIESTPEHARQAQLIFANRAAKSKSIRKSPVSGGATATASRGAVSVAIAGHNQSPINIRVHSAKKQSRGSPENSIGGNANLTNYIEYLCGLWVDYMMPATKAQTDEYWQRIGTAIKRKFRLKKPSRNDLSAERFFDLVEFLVDEQLPQTPVGRKHRKNGTRLCRTFEEFRHGTM